MNPVLLLSGLAFAIDADGDGFASGVDCNDTNATIHPGAPEGVGDQVDSDCDGHEICYTDLDNDGARGTSTVMSADIDCFDANEGRATDPIDCDDTDSTTYPGAIESIGDGHDRDCDGRELCYLDADDDGSRAPFQTLMSLDPDCDDPNEGLATDPQDCDDGNPRRSPTLAEVCDDGIDNDCDGALDPVWLSVASPGAASAVNTWDLTGGPVLANGHLVLGPASGSLMVPGCPGLVLGVSSPRLGGAATTDPAGDLSVSTTLPAATSGRTVYAQVVFPISCVASCVSSTAIP